MKILGLYITTVRRRAARLRVEYDRGYRERDTDRNRPPVVPAQHREKREVST